MKVIKCINNNVAICLDSNDNEIIAFGKGIGFHKPPYDIELNQIDRTYYEIDEIYKSMINDLSPEVIDLSDEIVNFANIHLKNKLSTNIVFTLADHIDFAIKRYRENIKIKLPILQDIKYLFETEMEIGEYAVKLIRKKIKAFLPDEEASYIALHIINSETIESNLNERFDGDIIDEITEIVEEYLEFKVIKEGFNYSRFVSHMHYLLQRGKRKKMIKSDNDVLYESLKNTFPVIYECSQKIRDYFKSTLKWDLTDEECIYLILHINRLYAREDCNQ